MDYLDYESTLPDIKRTFYSGFKFYSMDKVQDLIKNIPETPYGQYPEGVQPESESTTTSSGSSRLSPAEVARMNKVQAAKTLLIRDTRKAQAICDFVKTMFMRDMVPITDLSTQNCLYEAWLHQISNSDFMYNPDSGEPYSPLDLRIQLLYNMAVDYENYYPQVKMHLEIPYKLWIMKQLSEQTPSDMMAVAGLRHMFQVSINLKLFLLFSDHRRMFLEDLAA